MTSRSLLFVAAACSILIAVGLYLRGSADEELGVPGEILEPVATIDNNATYSPDRLGLEFAIPSRWQAIDRVDLFADGNVAERYDSVIELRAPVTWADAPATDGVGTLRRYSGAFGSVDDATALCIECGVASPLPIAVGDSNDGQQITLLIDARVTRMTLWMHDGAVYELKTDDRLDLVGVSSDLAHRTILDSVKPLGLEGTGT